MFWWVASAWALEVRVYAPDAAPIAGQRTTIEVALVDGDAPITGVPVTIAAARGRILDTPKAVYPGRWRFSWIAPVGVTEERFGVHVGERPVVDAPLALGAYRAGELAAPDLVEIASTDGKVELRFPFTGTLTAQDVVVRATEGRITETTVADGVLRVVLSLDARRDARVVHVGAWDRRRPETLPTFASVRLRERRTGTVAVEANASVVVKIGGRSYGPVVANAAGDAQISLDVLPGETTYEVVATDEAGNTSHVTSALGGDLGRPVVLLMDAEDEDRASVMVAAWQAGGAPWAGAAPSCRAATAERADANPMTRGLWRYDVDNPGQLALFDLKVDCAVAEVGASARLPVGAARADRIDLRAWPQELDADFPIAQVQAVLLDARGDRLPVEGLTLTAAHGWLAIDQTVDAIRADYQGGKAVAAGGDELQATWKRATSTSPPWNLHLHPTRVGDGITAHVEVHDRLGRAVSGAAVRVEVADGGAPLGSAEGRTDENGVVDLRLPGGGELPIITATSGGARGQRPILPGVDTPEDLGVQELVATLPLPIRAGRVRTVTVEVTGEPLATGDEVGTPVKVRLFDLANHPIGDEQVTIEADYGTVAGWRAEGDGTWTGRYVPPRALVDREVRLTATADGSSGAATLRLVPRPVRGGVSLGVGYIGNFELISSPMVSLTGELRMPFLQQLSLRVGGSGFWLRTSFQDDQTQGEVNVDVNFFPIEVGGMATQRWTHASIGGGVAALFVPFGMRATYASAVASDGTGMTSPGLQLTAEGAWRLGMSEVFLNARGLIYPGPTGVVTLSDGPVHLAGSVGYRVLY